MTIRAQVAPFGEHEGNHGRIEVFTREKLIKIEGKKVPVYRGHPDSHEHWDKYKDRSPRGEAVLVVTEFGLEADIELNENGMKECLEMVLHATDFGVFLIIKEGEKTTYLLEDVKSIGLSERPCMPIKPIVIPEVQNADQ